MFVMPVALSYIVGSLMQSMAGRIDRIAYRPNRVVAADGSIPHAARAPSDDKFRMSVIVRGAYTCRRSNPGE